MPTASQSRTHWFVAAGAVWTMIASAIHLTGLSIMTPFVTEQLGFDIGPYQVSYSLLSVASMITMPLAGRLIGRLGARRLLVIGGITAGLGLFAMSVSSELWHFYVAGIVMGLGVGLGCLYVPAVVVTTWFVAKRGAVMGVVMAGSGIGGIVMSQVVPRLVGHDGQGWRFGFVALALIMLASTLGPAWLLIRNKPSDLGLLPYGEDPDTHEGEDGKREPIILEGMTYAQALRSGWFWLLYLMLTLFGVATSIYQGIATHLRIIGMTPNLGLLMTSLTVGLVISKIMLGIMVDRIGLRNALLGSLAIYCVALLLMPGAHSLLLLTVLMLGLALGTANATVMPPLLGVATVGTREFPAIWGIGATAFSLGNGLGTPLWGAMRDASGDYASSFQLVPILLAVSVAGLFLAMHRGRASYQASTPADTVPDPAS